jgi:hypothetical protein
VVWTGLIWLKMGQVESSCECGNKPSSSINAGKLSSGFTSGDLSRSAQLHKLV